MKHRFCISVVNPTKKALENKKDYADIMNILYITYVDMNNITSGSGVRPARMYQAFLDEGHSVKLLSGLCGRDDEPARKKAVHEIMDWLKENRPDLCYIESPTYPIMFRCDYQLIRKLHKMHIPMGYFYRDFYRKFPDLFPRRKGIVNTLKELYLDYLQFKTDRILRLVDVVYYPSESCFKWFSYKRMKALPPAGFDRLPKYKDHNHTVIYVGGVSELYNGDMLLDAMQELNLRDPTCRLIMVCREAEWKALKHPCKNAPWLEVHHASGDALAPLYNQASVAIIGKKENTYNALAISVKIFEYMSYGLPQVIFDNLESGKLLRTERIGIPVEPNASAMADALEVLLNNETLCEEYRTNIRDALLNRHLWNHRVRQIVKDLTGAQ